MTIRAGAVWKANSNHWTTLTVPAKRLSHNKEIHHEVHTLA
jgi:hypothetical protein